MNSLIFDEQQALAVANNNPQLVIRIRSLMLAELNDTSLTIRQAIEKKSFASLDETLHHLKGTALSCAMPALYEVTIALKTALTEHNSQLINEQHKRFQHEILRIQQYSEPT